MSKYAFLRSNASLIIVGLLLGLIGGFKIANSQYRRDQGKALKRDIAQATSRMPGSQASQAEVNAIIENAREHPDDAEAQVAAAVGLFTKGRPAVAFSRLGPLSARFPHSQSVRFHLGELLIWIGQLQKARQELRLAQGEGKSTVLGKTSHVFLDQLQAKS